MPSIVWVGAQGNEFLPKRSDWPEGLDTHGFQVKMYGYGSTGRCAGIAQLVEHNLAKVGVASSSLVSRSKF
jgi:hypothetical protein